MSRLGQIFGAQAQRGSAYTSGLNDQPGKGILQNQNGGGDDQDDNGRQALFEAAADNQDAIMADGRRPPAGEGSQASSRRPVFSQKARSRRSRPGGYVWPCEQTRRRHEAKARRKGKGKAGMNAAAALRRRLRLPRAAAEEPAAPKIPAVRTRYSVRIRSRTAAKAMDRVWDLFPAEIQEQVWRHHAEATPPEPRVVFIRNLARVHPHPGPPQYKNEPPEISRISRQASAAWSGRNYRKMFARLPHPVEDNRDFWRAFGAEIVWDEPQAPLTRQQHLARESEEEGRPARVVALAPKPKKHHPTVVAPPADAEPPHPAVLDKHRHRLDRSEEQWVCPDADVVLLPPSCDGCLYNRCMQGQFLKADLAAIKKLAIAPYEPLNEAELLGPNHHQNPLWHGLPAVFPNLEILHVVVNYYDDLNDNDDHNDEDEEGGVGGVVVESAFDEATGEPIPGRGPLAMVRVAESTRPHLAGLRTDFLLWKSIRRANGGGFEAKLWDVRFVAVFHRRPAGRCKNGRQYPLCPGREGDLIVR